MQEKKKLSPDVIEEIKFLSLGIIICSVIMQVVFLLLGRYDYTVFIGSLVGAAAAIGNFVLLALTLQSALGDEEENVKKRVSASYNGRMILQVIVLGLSMVLPFINWVPVVITLLLPSWILKLRTAYKTKNP